LGDGHDGYPQIHIFHPIASVLTTDTGADFLELGSFYAEQDCKN
jgi:hypothetical protein